MNFKLLRSFLITHRQLIFVMLGIFYFFILFASPVFAQLSAEGTASAGENGSTVATEVLPRVVAQDSNVVLDFIAKFIFDVALAIGGLFTGIGGLFLDLAVTHTILSAGVYIRSTGVESFGGGITQLWQVIRDMCNILFIFSLIYLGIKTILKSDDSETQRKLGFIIIAALMINFSLFISQAIIDFTNIIAVQIFNQIMTGNASIAEYHDNLVSIGAKSISGAFMNVGNISSITGGADILADNTQGKGVDWLRTIIYGIMFMIFLIVAGVVFAMGAFLLVSRFIRLIIYMILSPAMFAGWIFPNFAQYQEKWWHGFFQQAFFAPAFLFMLYLSMVVLQRLPTLMKLDSETGLTAVITTERMGPGNFTIVLFFVMMIGFLYASIKVGEMMGIAGAKGAMSITQKAIGGVTAGLAARAGRGVIGGNAYTMAQDKDLLERSRKRGVGGALARTQLNVARRLADSSFDARNTGVTGEYLGKGKKGGYKTRLDEIKKKDEEFAKSLGQVDEDDEKVNLYTLEKEAMEHQLHELRDQRSNYKDDIRDKRLEDLKVEKEKIETTYTREKRANLKELESIDKTDPLAIAKNKARLEEIESKFEDDKQKNATEVASAQALKRQNEKEIKEKLGKNITDLEKAIKKQNETINQEKNRRQTGAYVDAATHPRTIAKFSAAVGKLKEAEDDFHHAMEHYDKEGNVVRADEGAKREAAKKIREANKAISDLKREAKRANEELGYAGILEGGEGVGGFMGGWVVGATMGRTRNQNVQSGKGIRKTFGKNSIKESASHEKGHEEKHDDHAGDSHDAGHGGDSHAKPAKHP